MTLCVLGGINWDVATFVDALPRPGETISARTVMESAGGKGLNQAVAAARFGAHVRLIGAVGDDDTGARLRAYAAGSRVDVDGVITLTGAPTGQAQICVAASGENTIVVAPGANAALTAEAAVAAIPAEATVFLTQFEAPPEAIAAMFQTPLARRGCKILNAAPALIAHAGLLALADIVVVNETELQSFSGIMSPSISAHPGEGRDPAEAHRPTRMELGPGLRRDERGFDSLGDVEAAARRLLTSDRQTVIVTLGARGVVYVGPGGVSQVPGWDVSVVDTTGAGDCFCAVLAAGLAEGAPLDLAIRQANAAAALSVGRVGAAQSAPTRAEVDALMEQAA